MFNVILFVNLSFFLFVRYCYCFSINKIAFTSAATTNVTTKEMSASSYALCSPRPVSHSVKSCVNCTNVLHSIYYNYFVLQCNNSINAITLNKLYTTTIQYTCFTILLFRTYLIFYLICFSLCVCKSIATALKYHIWSSKMRFFSENVWSMVWLAGWLGFICLKVFVSKRNRKWCHDLYLCIASHHIFSLSLVSAFDAKISFAKKIRFWFNGYGKVWCTSDIHLLCVHMESVFSALCLWTMSKEKIK